MIGRLLAVAGKDARLLLRNRALLAGLLLYPFLLAAVLGAAFQEPPARLGLLVLDEDAGEPVPVLGENLTTEDLLEAARPIATLTRVGSLDEGLSRLRRGEADALLHVQRGFLLNLSTLGTNATLRLVVDESDPVRAGVARNAVEGAVDAFVEAIVRKKIAEIGDLIQTVVEGGVARVGFADVELMGIEEAQRRLEEVEAALPPGSPERASVGEVLSFMFTTRIALGSSERYLTTTALPLAVESQGLSARDTRLAAVALPGALVLGVFWTGSLAAAVLASRDRETGVLRRLRASRGPMAAHAASKTLVALAAALVPAVLLAALGVAGLGARVVDPWLALGVLAAASLAAASLGALCAGLARASAGAALLCVLLLLPMLLLGGLFYPVAYMPEAAQAVARVLPVTLATDALRGALVRGSTPMELAGPLAGLVGFALAAGVAAALLARRR